jgi:hypothetical protein
MDASSQLGRQNHSPAKRSFESAGQQGIAVCIPCGLAHLCGIVGVGDNKVYGVAQVDGDGGWDKRGTRIIDRPDGAVTGRCRQEQQQQQIFFHRLQM